MSVQHQKKTNCLLSEGIKKLPTELREKIYNEYITIKLSQRKALGLDKVIFMLRHKILKSKFNRPAKLLISLGVT